MATSNPQNPSRATAEPLSPPDAGELAPDQFERVCRLLERLCGIHLQPGKEQLVKARLWKRVALLGVRGFREYLDLVESPSGASELSLMLDALTTNKTSFFREPQHFEFLSSQLRAQPIQGLRIWSAGCSSGQEPYSLAMTILDAVPDAEARDYRVLATDLSGRVLAEARAGLYGEAELGEMPAATRRRWFEPQSGAGGPLWRVADPVRRLVRFARLNLMDPWPMAGPFDFIFCRNVMIYFDRPTQEQLVRRFHGMLRSGGHLLVGHSESLTGRAEGFTYVLPAVYRR